MTEARQNTESMWKLYLRRFKKHRLGKIGFAILMILYGAAIFADILSPYTLLWTDKTKPLHRPSPVHFILEDAQGRQFRPFTYEEIITNQALRSYEAIPEYSIRAIGIEEQLRVQELRALSTANSQSLREDEVLNSIIRHYRLSSESAVIDRIRAEIRKLEADSDPQSLFEVYIEAVEIQNADSPIRFILAKGNKNFIQLFYRGVPYSFLGLFNSRIHVLGSRTGGYFPLGTDNVGRDILSRLLHGSRISLSVGLLGASITLVLGLLIGGIAGYFGGVVDNILMRGIEIMQSVPSLYLLFALRAVLPTNLNSLQVYVIIVLILSLLGWSSIARVIRGQVLAIKSEDFVLSAQTLGLSNFKIIRRHVLPNTMSYSIISVSLSIPGYILGESALSLLGLGITEPQSSWGLMLAVGRNFRIVRDFPWVLIPGFLIFLSILAWNFFGDGLRDTLDPKSNIEALVERK